MQIFPRHRVFISFHHEDESYRDWLLAIMRDDVVDEPVENEEIDSANFSTDRIRQQIRDQVIRDATVTIVLIGSCTWQRMDVDWEIGSSLKDTALNPRCGLLGIILPSHPDAGAKNFNLNLIPPRLADNIGGKDPYALIYEWSYNAAKIRDWIHIAFARSIESPPDNNRQQYRSNGSGPCSGGWHND